MRALRSAIGCSLAALTVLATTVSGAAARAGCEIRVQPGESPAAAVAAAPPGATICIGAGVYRLDEAIRPKRGQSILAKGKVILSGAEQLGPFTSAGANVWSAPAPVAPAQRSGECRPGTGSACRFANALFMDGRPLHRVIKASSLAPGTFWADNEHNRVEVYGEPAKHDVELAVTENAIVAEAGSASAEVTVKGLTVEMFANPAQHGAIDVAAPGWKLIGDRAELNHGPGITTNGHVSIEHVAATENGQIGLDGTGEETLVSNCLIANNNWAEFDPGWEAGGGKWSVANGLVVRDSVVRENDGPGLWSDIDSDDVRYEHNTVLDNEAAGIFYEISEGAVIAGNTVRGNGFGTDTWLWGSGILLAASHGVQVSGNTLSGNADGIGLIQQRRGVSERNGSPRVLHEVEVVRNVVSLGEGATGLVQDDGDRALFSDPTIVFADNTYSHFEASPFLWNDAALGVAEWRALGNDSEGVFKGKADH